MLHFELLLLWLSCPHRVPAPVSLQVMIVVTIMATVIVMVTVPVMLMVMVTIDESFTDYQENCTHPGRRTEECLYVLCYALVL